MAIEPPEPTQPERAVRCFDAERMRYRAMAQQADAIEGDRWTRYGIGTDPEVSPQGLS